MSSELLSKLIALILLYKYKLPQKKVSTILLEISSVGDIEPIQRSNVNDFFSNSSIDLPIFTENDWDFGQSLYEKNLDDGINILVVTEQGYPKYLKVIKDAPPLLFVKGNQDIFKDLPGVAIVGARECSDNGVKIAKRLAAHVVEHDWVVVSGLALGIDAAAHTGALESAGKTIAVLASGLDKPTPLSNAQLGYEILEKDGAWVSEHSIGIPAQKHHFVPRNRIQIGLSAGSIIVEAAIKSGSLSQARFCVGQNRPLFAVAPINPSNPHGLNCAGTLHMVDEMGAIAIRTKDDYPKLLELLNKQRSLIV